MLRDWQPYYGGGQYCYHVLHFDIVLHRFLEKNSVVVGERCNVIHFFFQIFVLAPIEKNGGRENAMDDSWRNGAVWKIALR